MSQVIDRPQKSLLGKIIIKSTIIVDTGLHIGGGGENLDIGGLDKPVIRDPITQQPYLPGSSIKGKLRAILERLLNKPLNREGGKVYRYESDDIEDGFTQFGSNFIAFAGAKTCQLSRIFGSTGVDCWIKQSVAEDQQIEYKSPTNIPGETETFVKIKGRNHAARLIVRDAHLTPDSAEKLSKIDTGLYMTEWKFENTIDRVTAAANPRQFERVPRGAKFTFEMVYTVEDATQVQEDIANIAIALKILEDDALGGHGSRGYGKIRFENFSFDYRDLEYYRQIVSGGNGSLSQVSAIKNTDDLLSRFAEIKTLLPDENN
jgi:CRISPR-associated protein Csm3